MISVYMKLDDMVQSADRVEEASSMEVRSNLVRSFVPYLHEAAKQIDTAIKMVGGTRSTLDVVGTFSMTHFVSWLDLLIHIFTAPSRH